jgi:hypothetical protein
MGACIWVIVCEILNPLRRCETERVDALVVVAGNKCGHGALDHVVNQFQIAGVKILKLVND